MIYVDPTEPLSHEAIDALTKDLRKHNRTGRFRCNADRWAVLNSQHKRLIAGRIVDQFNNRELIREMAKFVSPTLNPAADVTQAVCVAWQHGVTRRLVGEGEKDAIEAFHNLYLELGVDAGAQEWNRIAYYEGPVIVLPWMRSRKLRLEELLPHFTEVALDRNDRLGSPAAAAYLVGDLKDRDAEAHFAVVDAFSRRFFKKAGHSFEEVEQLEEEHGCGEFPGSTLRFERPRPDDWWVADRHPRLQHGALDCGRIFTTMSLVRRAQNKFLLKVIGPNALQRMSGNLGESERPNISFNKKAGENIARDEYDIDTMDFDVDPSNFHREIRFIIEQMAESTGVPVRVAALSGSDAQFDLEYDHNALTEFRNLQIWWARQFEAELARKTVKMARSGQHELATKLPNDTAGFSAEFPPMPRNFADIDMQIKWDDAQMSRGAISVLDIVRRQHPTLSPGQVEELHEENLTRNDKYFDAVAKRNAAVNAKGATMTAAQFNGSMGGRPPSDDNENDDENDDG